MMARGSRAPQKLSRLIRKRLCLDDNAPNKIKILRQFKQQLFILKEQNPNYISAHLAYAKILRDLNESQAALSEYEKLENHSQNEFRYYWKTYLCHGIFLSMLGDHTESIAVLKKIVHFDKTKTPETLWPTRRQKAEAYNALAIVYGEVAKFDLMFSHLNLAINADPTYAPAWSGLGKHYSNSKEAGSQKKAFECFETARRLNPHRYNRLHSRSLNKSVQQGYSKLQQSFDAQFDEDSVLETMQQDCDLDLSSEHDFPPLPAPTLKRALSVPINEPPAPPKQQAMPQLFEIINTVSKETVKTETPQASSTAAPAPLPAATPPSNSRPHRPKWLRKPRLQRALTAPEMNIPSPLPLNTVSLKPENKSDTPPNSTAHTLQLLKLEEPQPEPFTLYEEKISQSTKLQRPKAKRRKKPPASFLPQVLKLEDETSPLEEDKKEENLKSGCWEKTKNKVEQLRGGFANTLLYLSTFSILRNKMNPAKEAANPVGLAPAKGSRA